MNLLKAGISVSGEDTCRIGTQIYRVNSPQRHYYTTILHQEKGEKMSGYKSLTHTASPHTQYTVTVARSCTLKLQKQRTANP